MTPRHPRPGRGAPGPPDPARRRPGRGHGHRRDHRDRQPRGRDHRRPPARHPHSVDRMGGGDGRAGRERSRPEPVRPARAVPDWLRRPAHVTDTTDTTDSKGPAMTTTKNRPSRTPPLRLRSMPPPASCTYLPCGRKRSAWPRLRCGSGVPTWDTSGKSSRPRSTTGKPDGGHAGSRRPSSPPQAVSRLRHRRLDHPPSHAGTPHVRGVPRRR